MDFKSSLKLRLHCLKTLPWPLYLKSPGFLLKSAFSWNQWCMSTTHCFLWEIIEHSLLLGSSKSSSQIWVKSHALNLYIVTSARNLFQCRGIDLKKVKHKKKIAFLLFNLLVFLILTLLGSCQRHRAKVRPGTGWDNYSCSSARSLIGRLKKDLLERGFSMLLKEQISPRFTLRRQQKEIWDALGHGSSVMSHLLEI